MVASVTTQAIEAKRIRRIPKASIKPTIRALVRCSGGNFSAKMAIKTRLSIPSTISRTINVVRPQADGSDIHSKIIDPAPVLVDLSLLGNAKGMPRQGE